MPTAPCCCLLPLLLLAVASSLDTVCVRPGSKEKKLTTVDPQSERSIVSSLAMPMTKEEKARRRAMSALQAGRCFHARGSTNKARLRELRTEAASSSSKRIRVEQIEAMPAAPAPAALLSGTDEEEAEEKEKEEVRPEATELLARAPEKSFETVLAKRAAQALATQRGIQTPPLPLSWLQDNVVAFYSSSEAFNSELRAMRKTLDDEVDKEYTTERKRCRQCKKEGYSAADPYMTCQRHERLPESCVCVARI